MKKRVFTIVLTVLMILSCIPTAFAGDEPQETAQPQVTETPQIPEEPTTQPAETPAPITTPEPTAIPEPSPEPSPEPTVEPEPSLEPVMQPEEAMLPQSESEAYIVNATSGDYDYSVNTDGVSVTITGYHGTGGDIRIPDTLNGYKVTMIGLGAFDSCGSITGVQIPEGVVYIKSAAFSMCKNLTSVTLPNSLITMGSSVFSATAIINIFLPANLSYMDNAVFSECVLLESIEVDVANKYFAGEDGVLYNKTKTKLIRCPQKKAGAYTIPATVTQISGDAFEGCLSLSDVNIPDSVIEFDQGTFYGCSSLRSIYLPDGIREIPMWAFCGCTNLQNVRLPANLTKINEVAFAGCSSLKSITIPDSVNFIGGGAFQECSGLTNIAFPKGLSSFESGIFRECISLTSFVIPDGVSEIKSSAFEGCTSLESVTIPDSVRKIGDTAFSRCENLKQLDLPSDLDTIDFNAFKDCSSLTNIMLPDTIDVIETGLFLGCKNLKSVNIPTKVTKIMRDAFANCKSIKEIIIPAGVTEIDENAFCYCSSLEEVYFSDGLKDIGEAAFFDCESLKKIIMPEHVISIGDEAFSYCEKAETLYIPESVTSIGQWAFYRCSGIKRIILPEYITEIKKCSFAYCSGLTDIVIPEGVTNIVEEAFYRCTSLNSVTLPDSLTTIGVNAFNYTRLETVILPKSLRYIGNYAFYGCENLEFAYFKGNAPIMGSDVFPKTVATKYLRDFKIFYKHGCSGYTNPWYGYPMEETQGDPYASYTIKINYMDGSPVKTITSKFGFCIWEPEYRSIYGRNIYGWCLTPECNTAPVTFPYSVIGNVELYAKLVPWDFTVYFYTFGGSEIPEVKARYGETISKPATPTKNGYLFGGWYLTPQFDSTSAKFPYTVTSTVTLFSKWERSTNRMDAYVYLADLHYSAGSLLRAFSRTTTSYKVALGEGEGSFTIAPVKEFDDAEMTINGKAVSSYTVNLANGKSVKISVKVRYGKASKTYTFTVTRAKSTNNMLASLSASAGAWSQPFDPNVANYTLNLDENTKSTAIKATAVAGKIAGVSPASTKVTLNNGQSKIIKVTVKAQSGAKRTYTITVIRAASTNANLKMLKVPGLTPAFSPDVTSYAVTLPANKGTFAVSAKAVGYKAAVYIDSAKKSSKSVALANGQTVTVVVKVVSQAGSEKDYVITVTRQ